MMGPFTGGPQCRVSNLRNGGVACLLKVIKGGSSKLLNQILIISSRNERKMIKIYQKLKKI